jgi:hypothetical protein
MDKRKFPLIDKSIIIEVSSEKQNTPSANASTPFKKGELKNQLFWL